jgi:hypothetical protein
MMTFDTKKSKTNNPTTRKLKTTNRNTDGKHYVNKLQ